MADYLRELKAGLEAISAVTNLHIDIPDVVLNEQSFECAEDPGEFVEGADHFPPIGFGAILFELHIPRRVQEELVGESGADGIGTERFAVHIDYMYEGPVAFVVLLDAASGERSPSNAVVLVREFLLREIREDDTPIRLDCLGPSPFHAEFCLRLVLPSVSSGSFRVEYEPRIGYDLVRFTSDHAEYALAVQALQSLRELLSNELGFFYWVRALEARWIDQFATIQEQVSALTSMAQKRTFWYRLTSKIRRSSMLRDVFASLIGFDVTRTFQINRRQELYRSTYPDANGGLLRPYVDRAIADAVDYPTKQITTLVGFLERRHSKAVELAVVMLAAVIGGLAGGALTAFMKFSVLSDRPKADGNESNLKQPSAQTVQPSQPPPAMTPFSLRLQSGTPRPTQSPSPALKLPIIDAPRPTP
jgi:hypothetical protein